MKQDALVARVRELVALVGVVRAARQLGVGREVVVRIVAGIRVRPGSLALVEQSLRRGADNAASPTAPLPAA